MQGFPLAPQTHLPATQESASAGSHATHLAAGAPQLARVGGLTQVPSGKQQPAGQTQAWPQTNWTPPPPQVSPPVQEPQLASAVPHPLSGVPQSLPSAAQVLGVQLQTPAVQVWPLGHGTFAPHLHAPLRQLSAVASQVWQSPPPVPHFAAVAGE